MKAVQGEGLEIKVLKHDLVMLNQRNTAVKLTNKGILF